MWRSLRWQAFTGQEATLDGDGRSFAEIAAERMDAKRQEDDQDRPTGRGSHAPPAD